MRVLVEAMCAEYGGIRTYAEHLLQQWATAITSGELDDEVHVLVGAGATLPVPAPLIRHEVTMRRPAQLGRPWAQTRHVARLVRELDADAALLTLPSTTVLKPKVHSSVVVYDLRHELRPEQFSRLQRLLRRVSYTRGYAVADHHIAISQRSLDDLHRLHPQTTSTPSSVVHLGADHVLGWSADHPRSGPAIAFGHHSNKNIDLVLAGWIESVRRDPSLPTLRVLGRAGATSPHPAIEFAPFLPEAEFETTLAQARIIVFPTDFEGFGLPVVEGMLLGVPVVIGPEAATMEVAGGHAEVMTEWSSDALAEAVLRAMTRSDEQTEQARAHAAAFTWRRVLTQTRATLTPAGLRPNDPPPPGR